MRRPGFSLIEIMIVVSVIGILAAIVLPVYRGVREKSQAVAAAASMVQIAKALDHYHATHGDWPGDLNRRQLPPELKPYLPNDDFKTGPIGGVWDYDDWRGQGHTAGGDPVAILISIVEGDPNAYALIDREIDDGNLSTGTVRVTDTNSRLAYILRFEE